MVPPPPHPSSAPSAQYASQFLSTALSQRGPSALPYAEDAKWLIRHHLVSLVDAFPSLIPKVSLFTHNDGRTVHLLQAEGTIPIVYAGVVYNIPATIWLLESYPRSPPSVFLTPTSDMVVKPNHRFVDRSGHVSVPYLGSWVYPSSNLVDLVSTLSHLFGQDPPLYTRQPPLPTSAPSPTPNPKPNSGPDPTPSYSRPSSSSSSYPASPYGARFRPSPHNHRPTEDPGEVFRRNAMNKILETAHLDMVEPRKKTEAEMEGLFSAQAELRRRKDVLSHGLREMQEEKEGLEQQLQLVLMNTDILEGWVRENEGKKLEWRDVGIDVDDVFETSDVLSRQLLEYTMADMAIEDVVYALDKAMQDGAVRFDVYLKQIRVLSREQFFHRATSAKVRAAQVQAQVASMALRVQR